MPMFAPRNSPSEKMVPKTQDTRYKSTLESGATSPFRIKSLKRMSRSRKLITTPVANSSLKSKVLEVRKSRIVKQDPQEKSRSLKASDLKSKPEPSKSESKKADIKQASDLQQAPKSTLESHLSSLPSGFPSDLKNIEELKKSRQTLHWMRALIKNLNTIIFVYAFYFVILGIFQKISEKELPDKKIHVFSMGMVGLLPLFSSPSGYLAYHLRNSVCLGINMVLNFLYLIGGILYLFIMYLVVQPVNFTKEIVLIAFIIMSLLLSALLLAMHCLLLKQTGVVVLKKVSKDNLDKPKSTIEGVQSEQIKSTKVKRKDPKPKDKAGDKSKTVDKSKTMDNKKKADKK